MKADAWLSQGDGVRSGPTLGSGGKDRNVPPDVSAGDAQHMPTRSIEGGHGAVASKRAGLRTPRAKSQPGEWCQVPRGDTSGEGRDWRRCGRRGQCRPAFSPSSGSHSEMHTTGAGAGRWPCTSFSLVFCATPSGGPVDVKGEHWLLSSCWVLVPSSGTRADLSLTAARQLPGLARGEPRARRLAITHGQCRGGPQAGPSHELAGERQGEGRVSPFRPGWVPCGLWTWTSHLPSSGAPAPHCTGAPKTTC